MNFGNSRIYRCLTEEPFHKVAKHVLRLTEEGRDVNFTSDKGDTYLHVVAENAEKFRDPRAVPVVYQLCLAGIYVDAQNSSGQTCLHVVVTHKRSFRIVVALLRCGADPSVTDEQGRTAEDILAAETPAGWEETLYWLKKFSPGLRHTLREDTIDLARVDSLLSAWCRLYVYIGGVKVNLIDQYKASDNVDDTVLEMLERHLANNELALATLAGSPTQIKIAGANEKADVNTRDHSYRYHYVYSPEVAQPLLAAAWEQDSYDVIDQIMSLSPDTSVMYANHNNRSAKPVLFHIISGIPKPENVSLLHRVLRDADLSKRNHKGQTVLFEVIQQKIHVEVFSAILTYGVDLAARDYKGRTARDYANELDSEEYMKAIDSHVIQMVNDRRSDVIVACVTRDYDHISDVVQKELDQNERLRDVLKDNRLYKETAKCVQEVPRTQRLCRLLMDAADRGQVDTLQTRAVGHVIECQNKCGHTLLHRGIMTQQGGCALEMLSCFPHLIDIPDNIQRTPLHYANLFFGHTHQVSRMLLRLGARTDVLDIYGRSAAEYEKDELTTHQYSTLYREVMEFEGDIYLREIDFKGGLVRAIQAGDEDAVVDLLHKAGPKVKMADYSQRVFDCIDHGQPNIAVCLLQNGCDPDVWKQYEVCDPSSEVCMTSQCRHPIVSLQARSKEMGFDDLAQYIDDLRKSKMEDKTEHGVSNPLQVMSNFGILAQA